MFVGSQFGIFVRVPELYDVRSAAKALGLAIARTFSSVVDGADHHLRLDARKPRMDRELLEKISEQLATALCAENLVDRLERPHLARHRDQSNGCARSGFVQQPPANRNHRTFRSPWQNFAQGTPGAP